jgi:DNA-binding TFAR19-related protein (PDSD5 family)
MPKTSKIRRSRLHQLQAEAERLRLMQEEMEPFVAQIWAIKAKYFDDEITPRAAGTLRNFLLKMPLDRVAEAMELACNRKASDSYAAWRYFCGICWNIIKGRAYE